MNSLGLGGMNRPMADPRAVWYVVSVKNKFTCGVVELDGKIIEAAPILKRFTGQPLANLKNWIASLNGTVSKL
jgi:hypothetical protein